MAARITLEPLNNICFCNFFFTAFWQKLKELTDQFRETLFIFRDIHIICTHRGPKLPSAFSLSSPKASFPHLISKNSPSAVLFSMPAVHGEGFLSIGRFLFFQIFPLESAVGVASPFQHVSTHTNTFLSVKAVPGSLTCPDMRLTVLLQDKEWRENITVTTC